jgi:hypothetical protein
MMIPFNEPCVAISNSSAHQVTLIAIAEGSKEGRLGRAVTYIVGSTKDLRNTASTTDNTVKGEQILASITKGEHPREKE